MKATFYKMFYFLFAMMGFSIFSNAHEISDNLTNTQARTYILPEQVFINDEGIFLLTDDKVLPISQLNFDSEGLYIASYIVTKGCKHPKICICDGCGVSKCPNRCRCKTPIRPKRK